MTFWLRKRTHMQKLYLSWEDKWVLYKAQPHKHHLRELVWALVCFQHLLAECAVERSLKLNRKKIVVRHMCVFFHISFPSSTLLMVILLFNHEILFRIRLKCKGDLIPKAFYFLWISEAHLRWRISQLFLEQSLFSLHPVPTPRMTRDTEEREKLSPTRCLPRTCW